MLGAGQLSPVVRYAIGSLIQNEKDFVRLVKEVKAVAAASCDGGAPGTGRVVALLENVRIRDAYLCSRACRVAVLRAWACCYDFFAALQLADAAVSAAATAASGAAARAASVGVPSAAAPPVGVPSAAAPPVQTVQTGSLENSTWGAVAAAYGDAGDARRAIGVVDAAVRSGTWPDAWLLTAVMEAASAGGDLSGTLDVCVWGSRHARVCARTHDACRYEAMPEFCAAPVLATREAVRRAFMRAAAVGTPGELHSVAVRVASGAGPLSRDAHALRCLGTALAARPDWDDANVFCDIASAAGAAGAATPGWVRECMTSLKVCIQGRFGDLADGRGIGDDDRRWLGRIETRAGALARASAATVASRAASATADAVATAAAAEELHLWVRRKRAALPEVNRS